MDSDEIAKDVPKIKMQYDLTVKRVVGEETRVVRLVKPMQTSCLLIVIALSD